MRTTLIVVMLIITSMTVCGQDSLSLYDKAFNLPDKLFGVVYKKSDQFQKNFSRATYKYLNKLERKELKMKRQIAKKDSAAANEIFGDVKTRYSNLRKGLNIPGDQLSKVYSGHIDSMKTALSFLNNNKILGRATSMQNNIKGVFNDYRNVETGLNQSDFIEKQLKERQRYLSSKLQTLPIGKSFVKFKKDVYYYKAQVEEYKRIFEDPVKLENLIISSVKKVPAFQSFFARYSELGSIFQLPGNDLGTGLVNNMQTRQSLMQELGSRLGAGPNVQNQISNNIANAQSALQSLKDKIGNSQSNGDPETPGFKSNNDKVKSFLKRIEVGFNTQSVKSNYFLPSTTDLGLSLGYRIKPNIICGLGASYKMGWGKDLRNIRISHEGIGLRSYAELKLKGNFWITGGTEMNYYSSFKKFEELKNRDAWQKSILAGLNKKYQIKKYKGELKILYDFNWNKHLPQTQPIVFRVGYSLK